MNDFNNITIQNEKDFRFINDNIDIWPEDGSFPFKPGDKFPTDKLIERANISYTNRLLYNNKYGDVFNSILSVIPEIDSVYAQKIKDIIADLPFFKIVIDAFVSLCISTSPLYDTPDELDQSISDIIERSNMRDTLESIIKSLFLDVVDAYRITTNLNGDPIIEQIPNKNMIIYNHPDYMSSVCCVLVSNVLTDKVEFIEYWYDGKIIKRVFNYANGRLGDETSYEEGAAFGGKYKKSPIVVIRHNTDTVNDTYGHDQLSSWDGAVVALCRTFSNMMRLNERVREIIKVVPESSLSIFHGGQAAFVNRGVITYSDGQDSSQRPDVSYVIPEIKANIEACKETLERCIKMLSMSACISPSWFDPEKTGTNLSGKSLQVAMMPTILKSKMIVNSIESSVREIICKLAYTYDIEVKNSQIDITWFTGIYAEDERETSDIIDTRLKNNTISKEDAIIKIDKVSRRIAKERAAKLSGQVVIDNGSIDTKPINTDDLELHTEINNQDTSINKPDTSNVVPDYQMPFIRT